jgi:branched-chain amino acid transport system substrate-binding protein
MKKVFCWLLAITGVISWVLIGWASTSTAKEEIFRFGLNLPYTGDAAWIGEALARGADLAVDEINARGGIDGVKLQAVKEDSKALPREGVSSMVKLATLDKVPFVVTSFSGVTMACQPIAAENKVLLIDLGSASSEVLNKPFLYTIAVPNVYMMSCLGAWLCEKGYRKGSTLVLSDSHGRDTAATFVKKWSQLGGTIVAQEEYGRGDVAFSAQIAKIKAADPDVVVGSAVGKSSSLLIKQMHELGLIPKTVHINGKWDQYALNEARGASIGVMAIDFLLDVEGQYARDFVKAFSLRYGKNPSWQEANGYEAIYILAELIKRVKAKGGNYRSGETLRDALEGKREFASVYGEKSKFGDEHAALKPISIVEVIGFNPYKHKTHKVFSIEEMIRMRLK